MSKTPFLYNLLRFLVRPFAKMIFNIKGKNLRMPEGANLIISNHVTNVDFLMLAIMTSGRFMSFVIADNAMRKPWLKKLVYLIDKPIIHTKGTKSLNTIQEMSKRLKAGDNVMIFPEGNTCFDGTTAKMEKSIGKLAKMCGSNLVTYRIRGGYLTMPRWGKGIRRGQITIESNVYTADELKKMTAVEVAKLINDDLYVDAYDDQTKDKVQYKSSKACLGLERAMYRCPLCGSVGTLKSEKVLIKCNCGYVGKLNCFGYLSDESGDDTAIKNHLDNQRNWIKEKISKDFLDNESDLLFEDVVDVYKNVNATEQEYLGKYLISAYSSCIIEYKQVASESLNAACKESKKRNGIIKRDSIRSAVIFGANTLTAFVANEVFLSDINSENTKINTGAGETVYEIHGDFSFNALKYRDLFELSGEV